MRIAKPRTSSKLMNSGQIKIIYTLGNELNLVDKLVETDMLHELVYNLTGCQNVSKLTNDQAIEVIDKLKGFMKGAGRVIKTRSSQKAPSPVPRPGMANGGQIRKIKALMYELAKYDIEDDMHAPIEKRLNGILRKYAKVDDLMFLTSGQAWRVIENIKGMIETAKKQVTERSEAE